MLSLCLSACTPVVSSQATGGSGREESRGLSEGVSKAVSRGVSKGVSSGSTTQPSSVGGPFRQPVAARVAYSRSDSVGTDLPELIAAHSGFSCRYGLVGREVVIR